MGCGWRVCAREARAERRARGRPKDDPDARRASTMATAASAGRGLRALMRAAARGASTAGASTARSVAGRLLRGAESSSSLRARRDARVRVRQRGVADASIRERARGGRRRDERGARSGVRGRRRDVAGRERRGRGAVAAETRAGAAIGDAVEAEGRAERLDARARARDSETCATRPDRTRRDPSRRPRSSIVLLSSDRSNDRSARCFFSPPAAPPRRINRPA